ncbi:MAG TPA: DEAD/DEAH box helicase [Gaiellaceae bacterium]|nr:DEAD/DEAH box helicase [Gaiellaceae bacterium]
MNQSFRALGVSAAVEQGLADRGIVEPFPVQTLVLPEALAGRDVLAKAPTGSGKTLAFGLPIVERTPAAGGVPRALVLVPTRELALQVCGELRLAAAPKGLRVEAAYGGAPVGAQAKRLRGAQVVVATPGRLQDLVERKLVSLAEIETLVLDEADRMLDMGFIDDIRAIAAATPQSRQTLLFSATLGGEVARLAEGLLRAPRRIELQAARTPNAAILQRLHWADNAHHKQALLERLLADPSIDQAIVFTSTQVDAERVSSALLAEGHSVAALHGGMPQGQRNRTLGSLRRRNLRVLVATDVAARGIDVPTISHVINYGLPMKAEDYVHRIGRTGRAGREGLAVTLAEHQHAAIVRRIERYTGHPIHATTLEGLEPRTRAQFREATRKAARKATRSGARPAGRPASGRPASAHPAAGKPYAARSARSR